MKKSLLTLAVVMTAFAAQADWYVTGDNVNGQNWKQGEADARFSEQPDGTFVWEGQVLGDWFKINNGTYDDVIGASKAEGADRVISDGVPFIFTQGADGDIESFDLKDCDKVLNPRIVLNLTAKTVTVTGQFQTYNTESWFIVGINDNWNDNPEKNPMELLPTDNAKVLKTSKFSVIKTEGDFKITSRGWGTQYATYDNENCFVSNDHLTNTLALLTEHPDNHNVHYNLTEGEYTATFNLDTLELTFSASTVSSVVRLPEADTQAPVYYNLQGIRVDNPLHGVFIKRSGIKSIKIVK